MTTTKVTFEFPSEAWDGIILSLTDGQWSETVLNPAYDGTDPEVPATIPNPEDRAQLAIAKIKRYVQSQFEPWALRERMALIYQQNQAEVKFMSSTVMEATTATIEVQ